MMAILRAGPWLLAAATAAAPLSANAQEQSATADASADTSATTSSDAQAKNSETAAPSPAPLWTATASAGVSARDDGPDGTWQALSLTRRMGRGYLRGAVMRYHGTLVQTDTALPSDYFVATLAGGGNFHGWVTDGWISLGRQDYGRISMSEGSRASSGAKGSTYFATGGDFGKVLTLGSSWYLTPTVTATYAHGKLLRPAPAGTDYTDLETDEPTWSANAALRIDHAFGSRKNDYVGLSIARNWTSNAVSAVRPEVVDDETGTLALTSKHYSDFWFEVGATANMQVTPTIHIDVFATRGFGMLSGDTTSGGIALRKSF